MWRNRRDGHNWKHMEKCETCKWWVKDYGLYCMNGWSGMDRDDGYCHYYPEGLYRSGKTEQCHFYEEK